jgi:hypothetical protein
MRRAKEAKPWKLRASASTAGNMCTHESVLLSDTSTTVSTWGGGEEGGGGR